MNCKGCIHYECCCGWTSKEAVDMASETASPCNYFKDNSDVVPKTEIVKIFEEIELPIRKAIEGWRIENKCHSDRKENEMIEFRIGGFEYCLYEIDQLKKKYTEGEQYV